MCYAGGYIVQICVAYIMIPKVHSNAILRWELWTLNNLAYTYDSKYPPWYLFASISPDHLELRVATVLLQTVLVPVTSSRCLIVRGGLHDNKLILLWIDHSLFNSIFLMDL